MAGEQESLLLSETSPPVNIRRSGVIELSTCWLCADVLSFQYGQGQLLFVKLLKIPPTTRDRTTPSPAVGLFRQMCQGSIVQPAPNGQGRSKGRTESCWPGHYLGHASWPRLLPLETALWSVHDIPAEIGHSKSAHCNSSLCGISIPLWLIEYCNHND